MLLFLISSFIIIEGQSTFQNDDKKIQAQNYENCIEKLKKREEKRINAGLIVFCYKKFFINYSKANETISQ